MPNKLSLVDLGKLSRPATVLIERVSDAVGGIYKPFQIKRVARAESAAAIIHAQTKIEISDMERRAMERLMTEETRKQKNIESITAQAAALLEDDAKPEDLADDWIANFFDKSRIVSDAEMQIIWAKILAGEATRPGSFSKRTVNIVPDFEVQDANLFTELCTYVWQVPETVPLIFDIHHEIYNSNGVDFDALKHLDDIGLVTFDAIGYSWDDLPTNAIVTYYDTPVVIQFPKDDDNRLKLGMTLLTKVGSELAPICGSTRSGEFFNYVLERWSGEGLRPYSPVPIN